MQVQVQLPFPALLKISLPEGKNAKQDDHFEIETSTAAYTTVWYVVTVCSFL